MHSGTKSALQSRGNTKSSGKDGRRNSNERSLKSRKVSI
jgi:hypothetical protein